MSRNSIVGLMAMAIAMDNLGGSLRRVRKSEPNPAKPISETNKRKGLTEFVYGENKLWALNKDNADKKAKKMGWL